MVLALHRFDLVVLHTIWLPAFEKAMSTIKGGIPIQYWIMARVFCVCLLIDDNSCLFSANESEAVEKLITFHNERLSAAGENLKKAEIPLL